MSWDLVVGLEIHAQVISRSKLFSSAAVGFGAQPNSQVAFLDIGMPGMLPVVNSFCVEQAVRASLVLGAKINLRSTFDRKNYFYPDLPLGYQITQFFHPIAEDGKVEIESSSGEKKDVRIERIHMEQDAAKIIHDVSDARSYVDFNRAGVALLEIVSAPDMRSVEEVVQYINVLRLNLLYAGVCDCDMEKGSFRCDANVSVKRRGEEAFGNRCEIKNLNSTSYIGAAIEYEMARHIEIIESGGHINQETRLFDVKSSRTVKMRDKENSSDYSYFPDPDLPELVINQGYVDIIFGSLSELPADKKARYVKDMGITLYEASVIIANKDYAGFFENVASECDPKLACVWIINELLGRLNKIGIGLKDSTVKEDRFIALMRLISNRTISSFAAKKVMDALFESDESPDDLVECMGLAQIVDPSAIENAVNSVLDSNPKQVGAYKGGKERLFGFFVGQVMKQTNGRADPALVNKILHTKLSCA